MFSEYWLRCSSKDKTITSIGAAFSQKNFPMYDPLELTTQRYLAGRPARIFQFLLQRHPAGRPARIFGFLLHNVICILSMNILVFKEKFGSETRPEFPRK